MSEIDQPTEWSEELLESYGKLSLPSLYDYLLSQEKLAAEIRKQNKELRANSGVLNHLQDNMGGVLEQLQEIINSSEHLETIPRRENEIDSSIKQMQQVLMGMMDALFNLLEASNHFNQTLLDTIPEFTGFWKKSKPLWRTQTEQILKSYYLGIELIRDKTLSALVDSGISVIIPLIGTPFNPNAQRAVEQLGGGKNGSIAKVIRYGYQRRDEIIRYSDVVVYQ